MSAKPDFSIVVASYNEGTQLLATMTAVAASLAQEDRVEMIVVGRLFD